MASPASRLVATPLLLVAVALAGACSPIRYIVVASSEPDDERWNADLRRIPLAAPEAAAAGPLLRLRSRSEVEEWARSRRDAGSAVEEVLLPLVLGDHARTGEKLRERSDELPEYLRLLLEADLLSERPPGERTARDVLAAYQRAWEAQPGKPGKAAVELRVRQLRYGR